MGNFYLKEQQKGLYLKNFDTANQTYELTTEQSEAKTFPNGEWFAKTELETLQFYFQEQDSTFEKMACVYEE